MRMFQRLSRPAAVICLGLMAACGGGGGGTSNSGSNNNGTGNNPPPAPTFHATAGVAQKGPLISGSTVTVQELDSALSPTGRQFSYQIASDLGTFSPTSTFNSQYLGVNATGYYFDEVLGAVSTGPVTLNSYNDLSTDSTLNVNLLTTLAYQRVKTLMTNSSMPFAAARAQAEGEVLKALNVPMGSYGSFGTLDLKGNSDGDRLLAVISSLFVNGNHSGNLSTLINNFQIDLGANGTITNPATKAALAASAATLNPSAVAANLTNRYASLGVEFDASDLAPWLDSDGDGVIAKFEFRVPDATPATPFTLPTTVVNNLVGKSITASAGQLLVNEVPVSGAVTIAANDVIAVSPGVSSFPDGVLNVYLISENQRMARVSFVSGLLFIEITPETSSIAKGLSQQFTATGHFSNNSTADLTNTATWSSSAAGVATINANGVARSLALGNTTITATSGSVAGQATLTVTPAELESFVISPGTVRTAVGLTEQLMAVGTYSDATTANVTSLANWQSNDTGVATVNAQTGLTTGVSLGTTTIDATIGSLTQSVTVAVVTNEFFAGPHSPVPFADHTATLLADGRVVAIGSTMNPPSLASVAIYNPATRSWSPRSTGNDYYRIGHTATLLPSGQIMVAGGAGPVPPSMNSAALYDPATDQWLPAPNMSTQRVRATAVLLPNGNVLVAGGQSTSIHASAELYDPVSNSWSAAGSMAIARSLHTMTLLADGKVLVTGGQTTGVQATPTAELYDPATNTWSSAGSMTAGRWAHTATLLPDGRVLVAGGGNSTGADVPGAEIYDPVTNTWLSAGTLLNPRTNHTATLMPDGKVLVAGGRFAAGGTTEFYDPATNTWSAGPPLSAPRYSHTATRLLNDVILLIGGKHNTPAELTSTELYL